MSSSQKLKAKTQENPQFQLLYGDDARFNYWESRLFNQAYLKRDIHDRHSDLWNQTIDPGVDALLGKIRDLAKEYGNKDRELTNWSETETINNWVKLVLQGLGWTNNCNGVQNPYLEETSFRFENKTYRTDILIVDDPKEKQYVKKENGETDLIEARNSVLIPVEVKYWDRLEEFRQGKREAKKRIDCETDDISSSVTPNEQIIQYMDILKKSWGILTDGATWRLFNRDLSSEDSSRYFEFNLNALVRSIVTEQSEEDRKEIYEAAKYFYYFFSKEGLLSTEDGKESFVDEVLRYSKKYVNKVEEDLKLRFVNAMNIACNGFHSAAQKQKKQIDVSTVRNVSESALFNILFIKSLESRGVLPMNSTDYKKVSLSNTIDKIEKYNPDKDEELNNKELVRAFKKGNGNAFEYRPNGNEIHDRIVRLAMVIHDGSSKKDDFGFEIAGFKESVFSSDEWSVFKSCKIGNSDWVQILFELGYAEAESSVTKYQQIPYSYFTPRQLGSIYESFLEFDLDIAPADMAYVTEKVEGRRVSYWKKVNLNSRQEIFQKIPTVKSGQLYFYPKTEDKKFAGAFYTPDPVVKYITRQTLANALKDKSSKEILEYTVIDPAMGSGHFLVAALEELTSHYFRALSREFEDTDNVDKVLAIRKVLDSCIFGVDLNPRAVKLAKLSLWLYTAHINAKLERLDDQLKNGDSLKPFFVWKKEFPRIFEKKGFDCVLGNPPWGGKLTNDERESLSKIYPMVSKGFTNTFKFFCDLGFRILKPNGNFGFIIPNTFLVQPKYIDLKEYFCSKEVDLVVNLGDGIFGTDVSAPCAVVLAINSDGSSKQLPLVDLSQLDIEQRYINLSGKLESSTVSTNTNGKNLEEFQEIISAKDCGIKHQRKGCGLENKGKSDLAERLYYEGRKESESDIPYINGTDLESTGFFVAKSTRKYLRGNFKKILKSNETVYFNKEMMNEKKKLIWRQTADRPIAAIHGTTYFANTLQAGVLTEKAVGMGLSYEYLACVLNSTWFRFLYLSAVMEQGRVFPQVKLTYLRKMPIPIPSQTDLKKIDGLYEKLIAGDLSVLKKIDEIIFKLYGCSNEQILKSESLTRKSSKELKNSA